MKKGIASLAVLAYAQTAMYIDKFKELKDDLKTLNDSPVEFNPDKLNRNHKIIPKNHKKFIIEGIEIYALSEKRAINKFKKKYEHIKNK